MFSASEVASYIAMVGVLSVVAQVRFLFLSVVQDFDCLNVINICFGFSSFKQYGTGKMVGTHTLSRLHHLFFLF